MTGRSFPTFAAQYTRAASRPTRRAAHVISLVLRRTQPMIITRSPLRISLGGGGTDLPSYYKKHSGFLIAAAIDKYVYITLHQTFQKGLILKYSKLERVASASDV